MEPPTSLIGFRKWKNPQLMCFYALSMYVHESKPVHVHSSVLHMEETTTVPILEALRAVGRASICVKQIDVMYIAPRG